MQQYRTQNQWQIFKPITIVIALYDENFNIFMILRWDYFPGFWVFNNKIILGYIQRDNKEVNCGYCVERSHWFLLH